MIITRHFFTLLFLFFVMGIHAQHAGVLSPTQYTTAPGTATQEECGTDAAHQRLYNNSPVYRQNYEDLQRRIRSEIANGTNSNGRAPLLSVPIVFHVMHLGEPEGTGSNISYEQVLAALQSLNDAYRGIAPYNTSGVDMEIEFCLASRDPSGNPTNGVNRVDASGTSDYATNGLTTSGTDNEAAIKALSNWGNTNYYNVWIVSEIEGNNGGGGIQGFAYFPGAPATVDGTVIMANSIGYDPTGSRCLNVKSFTNRNITFIHEMGHAFGLFHTFQGDGGGGSCPPNADCTTDGDQCCDTPPHERTNSTCPTGTNNLCGTSRDNHIHNFMDYSSDDCQTEFTNDQKTRARSFLTGGRPSLLSSNGCNPVAGPVSDFTTECAGTTVAGCIGSTVQFYDLSTRTPNSWSWSFPGGTPSTSTAQNPTVTYATAGIYPVTLTASNTFGAGTTETKTGYITIYATPTTACTNIINNSGSFGHAISNVEFANIGNTTSQFTNGYDDFSCTATTCVTEGQTYTLSIDVGAGNPTQGAQYRVFIDYNDDGDFNDAGEEIANGNIAANSGTVTRTHNITLPTTATENDLLRMRVIHDQVAVTTPCEDLFTGSSEDYGIYISSAAAITTQPSNTSLCAGGNASFTVAATGGVTFQWQENTGSGFTNITNGGIYSGATSATLTLTGVTAPMNGHTYQCIVGNGCDQSVTSNSASLTITSGLSITTQPGNQTGCVGDNASFTINAPSATTFQWQENTGGGFTNITNGGIYSGATTATLNLTGITAPMNGHTYQCIVSDGSCNGTSNSATLTVNSPPTITAQPNNASDCAGNTVTFSVTTSGGTFQWQENTGSGFNNITNGGIYSGATTATLTLTGITAPMNGHTYRCIATNSGCTSNSNAATLTVSAALGITTHPSNETGCVGDTENFTIVSPSATTFQWQEDNGGGFANITNGGIYSGATTATLTLTGITAPINGHTYRCLVSDGTCNGTSNSATLTVTSPPTITTQPTNDADCAGNNATFTVAASSGTFQWQEDNGGGFANITNGGIYSGATSTTLTLTGITAPMSGHTYRCIVTDGACSSTSNPATLTITAGPTVTTQPTAQSGCVGDTETFTVAATGATSFQWQENAGGGFINITNGGIYGGATSATLTLTGVTLGLNTYPYRCIVTNAAGCSTISSGAILTVNATPTITTQPTAQSGCVGDTETFTVAASSGTFQWQENTGSGFTNITNGGIYSGATTATLTLTGITTPMNGHTYQCIITDGTCTSTSNGVALTVNAAPTITTQPTAQNGCTGDTETFTIAATGATSFQWQEDNGGGFTNITNGGIYSGATTATLTLTGVTAPMNGHTYRCIATNTGCSSTSNSASLTINTTIAIISQPTDAAPCTGANTNFSITAPSATSFQWQEDNGGGFTNIINGGVYSGATTATLSLTAVPIGMNGNTYRCLISNGSCNNISDTVNLTVGGGPAFTTNLAATSTGCDNTNFSLNIAASGATNFQWHEFNGVTWNPISNGGIYSGATTATLSFTAPTGISGNQYYCAATSACGTSNSDTTTLNLIQITAQPTHQAGNIGNTVSFTSTSVNETCGTVWEIQTNSGWVALLPNPVVYPSGVAGTTLDVVVSSALDGTWYRRVACGPSCNLASDSAQLSLILTSDVRGSMYEFDGVDDYLELGTTPLGASNTQDISYTYEAWIYADDVTARQSVIGNHNYVGTGGTAIDINGGQARFFKQEGVDIISSPINASEWYHLAATYDAASDLMTFYINGVSVGTATSAQADGGGIHNVGTHSGDASVALSDFFNGKMDEVRIWNLARTQTEIREHMHLSLDGTEPGLMVYYQFDRDKNTGTTFGVRDAMGITHSTSRMAGSPYSPSQVHVGGGVSNTQLVTATGNVVFTGTNLEIDFPTTHPNGEVVVTHVTTENSYAPPTNAPFETGYWVVNNFGNTNTGLNSTPLFRYSDGSITSLLTTEYTLYKRPSRAFGAWPQTFNPANVVSNVASNNHCSFSGINDFSVLVPVNNTILLSNAFLTFTATPTANEQVALNWQIDNESNNKLFEVERSADGIYWEKVGEVMSINAPTTYQLMDAQPLNGANYYRIKTIDNNLQSHYSIVRVVEFNKNVGFWVYPNPSKGDFQIEFSNNVQSYHIEIFDAIGQRVWEQQLNSNKAAIDISNQASGVYTLKVTMNQQSYYSKIVIHK